MLSSYRAVLLRDGRVAIQAYAADRDAGVPETGVQTQYSVDGGRTWHHHVHAFLEDDFGRPILFEAVIGPLLQHADVLIAIRATDWVGNVTKELPVDAGVFTAPRHGELLLDSFPPTDPSGRPLFHPSLVERMGEWVDAGGVDSFVSAVARPQVDNRVTASGFEARRLAELSLVPALAHRWAIDLSQFISVGAKRNRVRLVDGDEGPVLRIRQWTK